MLHRLAFRLNRRVLVTALGIAVATMYLVASVTTLAAMRTSRDVLRAEYHDPAWVVHADAIVDRFHEPGTLPDLEDDARQGRVARVEGPEGPVVAATLSGEGPEPGTAWTTELPEGPTNLTRDGRTINVTVEHVHERPLDPSWIRLHPADLDALGVPDGYSFLVVETEPGSLPDGFHASPVRGAVPFFNAGAMEARGGLVLVVAVSVTVVALLLYHLMSMEVAERRHDIGVLGGIGAGPGRITRLFVLQAAFIALVGYAFGVSAASVLTRGIVRFAGLAPPTPGAWIEGMGIALGVTLVGTLVGAFAPVRRVARSTVVENLGAG